MKYVSGSKCSQILAVIISPAPSPKTGTLRSFNNVSFTVELSRSFYSTWETIYTYKTRATKQRGQYTYKGIILYNSRSDKETAVGGKVHIEVSMGATGDLGLTKVFVWKIIYSTDICGSCTVFQTLHMKVDSLDIKIILQLLLKEMKMEQP